MLPLLGDAPDLLVVQGDTSSALGAALAGFMAKVPVAHVEAGLRTHDPLLPWPEEEYRVAIDAHADLLFAPTLQAAENLRAEQVPGAIHVTGNTSIDRLVAVEAELPPRTVRKGGRPRVLVTCHRRESWAEGLEQIATALTELASDESADIELILHPNPHVESKMRQAARAGVGHLADRPVGSCRAGPPDPRQRPGSERLRRNPGGGARARHTGARATGQDRAAGSSRIAAMRCWSALPQTGSSPKRGDCSKTRSLAPQCRGAHTLSATAAQARASPRSSKSGSTARQRNAPPRKGW